MTPQHRALMRSMPSVATLLEQEPVRLWLRDQPRRVVVQALRGALAGLRVEISQGRWTEPVQLADVLGRAETALRGAIRPSLRRVLNATGVVLHTGLGRAPLSAAAVAAVVECARGYSNLELDLGSGSRGRRVSHVNRLLCELTGAEAATVVNNNAAATLLLLNSVARGREVIVSRGQLVEIGGSYRLPDVFAASGAILREVGTTNRTRIADYERAVGENTAALLRVHTSNYRVVGFTESAALEDMVGLGKRCRLVVIDDLGSGALEDLTALGLPAEPHARGAVAAGADLVCFSGDKLLGGPQAGIILGRADLIRQVEANPLMRTYRVDKMTLAALEATLRDWRDLRHATTAVPTLAALTAAPEQLQVRARRLTGLLRRRVRVEQFSVLADVSVAGGGSMPASDMQTWCVGWKPARSSVDESLARLRTGQPAVVARARADQVLFDVRTLPDEDLAELVGAVAAAAAPPDL